MGLCRPSRPLSILHRLPLPKSGCFSSLTMCHSPEEAFCLQSCSPSRSPHTSTLGCLGLLTAYREPLVWPYLPLHRLLRPQLRGYSCFFPIIQSPLMSRGALVPGAPVPGSPCISEDIDPSPRAGSWLVSAHPSTPTLLPFQRPRLKPSDTNNSPIVGISSEGT